jgi:hypothetical protein
MKTLFLILALTCSTFVMGQQDSTLIIQPMDLNSIGLHMERATELREASWICLFAGVSITALAAHDGKRDTALIGALSTLAVGYTFNLFALGHDRRAARMLRRLE